MKVQGPTGPQKTSKTSKTKKVDSKSNGFDDLVSSETSEAAPTKTTQSIAKVDALLAIQGAEDPTEKASRKRMRNRCNAILDELDGLRMAMLGGRLTVGHMIDVADVVASHRERIVDPSLTSIMDEIDLRAQVELAKMRMALEAKAG